MKRHMSSVTVGKADMQSWMSEHSGLASIISMVLGAGIGAVVKGRISSDS